MEALWLDLVYRYVLDFAESELLDPRIQNSLIRFVPVLVKAGVMSGWHERLSLVNANSNASAFGNLGASSGNT